MNIRVYIIKIFAAELLLNICIVVVENYYSKRVSDRKLKYTIVMMCFRSVGLNELHCTATFTRKCHLIYRFELKLKNPKLNAVNFGSGSPSTYCSAIKWFSGTKQ